MSPKYNKLAFVDIETTGTDFLHDRIIEISVLRVENGKLIKTFSTLINPETSLSNFITQITGITPNLLEKAPTIFDIKNDLLEILDGCIFVAHNARFDYSFIKTELKRLHINFRSKTLCTVKLSRYLFPDFFIHNLDAIINRFGFTCLHRHRAYDDAKVLFDFYLYLLQNISSKKLQEAFDFVSKKSTLPSTLNNYDYENLPESPGVYIFYGQNNLPIYIGKSQNIHSRVTSHFHQSISSPKEQQMLRLVKSIRTIMSPGDLSASILESKLIKELKPLHNRQLREIKNIFILKKSVDPQNYLTIELEKVDNIPVSQIENILGIFDSKKKAQRFLEGQAREHNLCSKLLNLEDSKGSCFLHQIDICHGACIQKEHFLKYNLRFLKAFSHKAIRPWPFSSPIIISEINPLNNLTEKTIVDHWCLLGTIKSEDEIENFTADTENMIFDYDIYKILKKFIFNPKNQSLIQTIKTKGLLADF